MITLVILLVSNVVLIRGLACVQAVTKVRKSYGLSAEVVSQPWSKCLQRSHAGYNQFMRYFSKDASDEADCKSLVGMYLDRGESGPVASTTEALVTEITARIDAEGFRVLNITAARMAAAESLANKSQFTWKHQAVGFLRNEHSHWKAVKYVVKAKFGANPDLLERFLTDEVTYKRSTEILAMKQLRRVYTHKGLEVFLAIVESKVHEGSDDRAIPCFLVNYLSEKELQEMLKIERFSKRDILRFLTSAIEQVEDPARPHRYRLHEQLIAEAAYDVQDAFVEYSETDNIEELSHRPVMKVKQWPYAVAKAAILEPGWVMRDAAELKEVLHICGISVRVKESLFCQWVTTAFVRKVMPLWSVDVSHVHWDKDVYMEIVRAMSVAINIKYPVLWGPSRLMWEIGVFNYRNFQ